MNSFSTGMAYGMIYPFMYRSSNVPLNQNFDGGAENAGSENKGPENGRPEN